MPLPTETAIIGILSKTLTGFAAEYPALRKVVEDRKLIGVARQLVGMDGRGIRKLVTEAMQSRVETTLDPGQLTVEDLERASSRWRATHKSVDSNSDTAEVNHVAH